MFLTNYQALSHVKGIIKLTDDKNKYLSCVRNYLRDVKVDVLSDVRADQFANYADIQELSLLIAKAETLVEAFLLGGTDERSM